MKLDDYIFTIVLAIISFLSGVIGLINRAEHESKGTFSSQALFLIFGGVSSIFVGFVSFEISFFYLQNLRVCVAISAFCAWMGTRFLIEVQDGVLEFVKNYKKRR